MSLFEIQVKQYGRLTVVAMGKGYVTTVPMCCRVGSNMKFVNYVDKNMVRCAMWAYMDISVLLFLRPTVRESLTWLKMLTDWMPHGG